MTLNNYRQKLIYIVRIILIKSGMLRKNQVVLFCVCVFVLLSGCQAASPFFPVPTKTINSGDVLFYDDFTNPASGWDRFTSIEGTMDYDGSGYRFLVNSLQTNFWSTPGMSFGDVRLDVDVAKLRGPNENRIGLLCRYVEGNYYFFMVSSDGFYTIGKFMGGIVMQLGQTEMHQNSAINTGLAVNHLRADCVGSVLTFYVNGHQVAQALDTDIPNGEVGLLAGTFQEPGVDVIFDNFLVSQP